MATVVITENTTGGTHTGVTDTTIQENVPTTNKDGANFGDVVSWGASNREFMLLRFAPPALGAVTVASASLGLGFVDAASAASKTLDLYEVPRLMVCSQATWNIYSTGNSWATAGALGSGTDRGATALASLALGNFTGAYVSWTSAALTAYVQTQLNASAPIIFLLTQNPDNAADAEYKRFVASEYTDGLRPKLTFDWSAVTGASAVMMGQACL